MLFLLNDTVLDLGLPGDTFARAGGGSPTTARLGHAIRAGQEALFAAGAFTRAHPDIAFAVAAEIALASEANAALFVIPGRIRKAEEVAVRLASAPLTTLVRIQAHQSRVGPDPAFVNQQVWNLALAQAQSSGQNLAGTRASA
ncbi:MAG: hypothetical protein SGJ23_13030 [Alphaproteobacteria bacterium]|nr:hypothetical protein [Alphaproteobacteria bacterium]